MISVKISDKIGVFLLTELTDLFCGTPLSTNSKIWFPLRTVGMQNSSDQVQDFN